MEQPDLHFYVETAYGIASVLVFALLFASILRARRARRNLAELEREDA